MESLRFRDPGVRLKAQETQTGFPLKNGILDQHSVSRIKNSR